MCITLFWSLINNILNWPQEIGGVVEERMDGWMKEVEERKTKAQQTETWEMAWSTSKIQVSQLKSADMSDVLGHEILNISGHVLVVQHKAINFFGIFCISLLSIPSMFMLVANLQDKNILCLQSFS